MEMEKPSIEEVLQCLDTLYRSENPKDKEAASAWLTKRVQSSVSVIIILLLLLFLIIAHHERKTCRSPFKY